MPPVAAYAAEIPRVDRLRRPRPGAGVVERRRLFRALDDPGSAISLVSAPAGSGKTTLLLSWIAAREAELPIAWLSARPGEDGHAFWAAAADAVAEVVPGLA